MECQQCGHLAIIDHTSGATDDGPFTEVWKCGACGARGRVTGDAADSQAEWIREGELFNDG